MTRTLVILLAWTMLAQPLVALGQWRCDCCAPTAPQSLAASTAETGAHSCCSRPDAERTRGENGDPQDTDRHERRGTCPMSCCAGPAPIGIAPGLKHSAPGRDLVSLVDEVKQSYSDAPTPRLKRPPRAPALV